MMNREKAGPDGICSIPSSPILENLAKAQRYFKLCEIDEKNSIVFLLPELLDYAREEAEGNEFLMQSLKVILKNNSGYELFKELYKFTFGNTIIRQFCFLWVYLTGENFTVQQVDSIADRLKISVNPDHTIYEYYVIFNFIASDVFTDEEAARLARGFLSGCKESELINKFFDFMKPKVTIRGRYRQ